ncbi:chymotrypsin-1 [Nasonia vitripennis]|uniref:Peptidase S1 domain-containing protein n=1 Tax=Nasonia vitripennis TaxID=7425 RepID=A0A7M7G6D0_NASVI|nr:chymotrypsin-1 [Nasonia vitripennis]
MKQLLAILCLAVSAYGQSDLGGTDAPDGAYPYQAALRRKSKFVCGASIINEHWLLTAAHCVNMMKDPKEATVLVGTNFVTGEGGHEYKVAYLIQHEDYDRDYIHVNDIALIRLVENIKFTQKVQPVKLPKDESKSYEGATAILAGWGSYGPNNYTPRKLQHIRLQVISRNKCANEWKTSRNRTIIPAQLCTSSASDENMATHGDSGGPLVSDGVQIGVVSFAWEGLPDVYGRVSSYLSWMNRYINY